MSQAFTSVTSGTTEARNGPSEYSMMHAGKSPTPHILVVDDEPLIRWSIAETLGREGYDVTEAQDCRTALQQFRQLKEIVSMVLLDLKLPDSQDLSLLERLHLMEPECPIVLMTAHGTPEIEREALARGARRVVGKPFDLDVIVQLVSDTLARDTH